MQPLEPLKGLVQVCGGLDHKTAEGGPDGAGDHARGNGTFLTGVRLKKSATDIRAGVSIDQVIARRIGHLTRFPSLELACDSGRRSGACDSGYCLRLPVQPVLELGDDADAAGVEPAAGLRAALRLGQAGRAAGQPGASPPRATVDPRLRARRRPIDATAARLRRLPRSSTSTSAASARLETRIEKTERLGDARDPQRETPAGVPPDFAEYVQLMFDMLILAFQTDSTRVATLLLAHDGSNRSFDQIGISEGHHDLTHHQNRPEWVAKVADIDLWYVRQFARFLEKLQATTDADGKSLLQNSMIVYGSGNADANRHTHDNLPVVLAGGGGGALAPGRYVKHGSKPLSNLYLSMADRMGLSDLERFGDSDARLGDV